MSVYDKLKELNITLPPVSVPAAAYVPYVQTGKLVFLSGHHDHRHDQQAQPHQPQPDARPRALGPGVDPASNWCDRSLLPRADLFENAALGGHPLNPFASRRRLGPPTPTFKALRPTLPQPPAA